MVDRIRPLYIHADNLLTLSGLRASIANSEGYLTVASCHVTLVVSGTSSEVGGQTWPLAFALVNSETGTWQTTLQDGLVVSEGQHLEALITIDAQDLGQRRIRYPLRGLYDKGE